MKWVGRSHPTLESKQSFLCNAHVMEALGMRVGGRWAGPGESGLPCQQAFITIDPRA